MNKKVNITNNPNFMTFFLIISVYLMYRYCPFSFIAFSIEQLILDGIFFSLYNGAFS
jgi:hypothetical protein